MKKEIIRQKISDIFEGHLRKLKLTEYAFCVILPEEKKWIKPSLDGFSVKVMYPYLSINLFVSEKWLLEDFNTTNEINIKSSLLHEAVHVLLWRYFHIASNRFASKSEFDDEDERLTDHIKCIIETL